MIPAILLAAGLSTRMGAFKPLMVLGDRTLLGHGVGALVGSGVISRVVVVTGHRGAEVEEMVRREWGGSAQRSGVAVQAVFNPEYAAGEMLSSVRAGLRAMAEEQRRSAGFLLAFADQPAVRAPTIRKIVEEMVGSAGEKAAMVIPTFLGKRGHPVVFSWKLWPAIAALLPGDTLRTVVHEHLAQARMISVEDASILDDLDTPEDFARAQARLRGESVP